MVLLSGTPMRDSNCCKDAQGKETQNTQDQEDDPESQHAAVFGGSTNNIGVLQQALLAVWMAVAHKRRQGNSAHG